MSVTGYSSEIIGSGPLLTIAGNGIYILFNKLLFSTVSFLVSTSIGGSVRRLFLVNISIKGSTGRLNINNTNLPQIKGKKRRFRLVYYCPRSILLNEYISYL